MRKLRLSSLKRFKVRKVLVFRFYKSQLIILIIIMFPHSGPCFTELVVYTVSYPKAPKSERQNYLYMKRSKLHIKRHHMSCWRALSLDHEFSMILQQPTAPAKQCAHPCMCTNTQISTLISRPVFNLLVAPSPFLLPSLLLPQARWWHLQEASDSFYSRKDRNPAHRNRYWQSQDRKQVSQDR